jgi:predicted negative regulator of RcsB-dependent stress response
MSPTIVTAIIVIALLFVSFAILKFMASNAMALAMIVVVCFAGYAGWHMYLKDSGITPKSIEKTLSHKGEKIFNKVADKAIDTLIKITEK